MNALRAKNKVFMSLELNFGFILGLFFTFLSIKLRNLVNENMGIYVLVSSGITCFQAQNDNDMICWRS